MRVTVQVRIEPDDADDVAGVSVIDVATIERGELAVDSLGLCIAEAKMLLARVQDAMVTAQVAEGGPCTRTVRRVWVSVPAQGPAHAGDAHVVRDDPDHQPTLVVMLLWSSASEDVQPDR